MNDVDELLLLLFFITPKAANNRHEKQHNPKHTRRNIHKHTKNYNYLSGMVSGKSVIDDLMNDAHVSASVRAKRQFQHLVR